MEATAPADPSPWWGSYTLQQNEGARWQIGPMALWVLRAPQEWRVFHKQGDDPLASGLETEVPLPEDARATLLDGGDPSLQSLRFSTRETTAQLQLQPALPDRPVVVRPETPIFIPPGENVTLYASVPVWIRIETGTPPRLLHEVPSFRLSDTWFGPDTREGNLCYAIRTSGRFQLTELPKRLHRAIAPVIIHNRAEDNLALERLEIPVQHLALYEDATDALWTQAVQFTRGANDPGAQVRLTKGAPRQAPRANELQKPREETKKSLAVSTFSALGSLFSP
ncbi:MAG: DUF432 domain-containing protein [Bacteroidetes bacterium]|jgi:hypothetical protein|nr:DUF432 domain-containing protein [Bacteroidota bacterium]